MHTESADYVTVDVDLPPTLLAEIDAYAATRGYRTPDAVVRDALAQLE